MIIDARSLPANHMLECDLCIVGGGPAGISLALELEDSPYRICLLESGGLDYERSTQALLKGEVLGSTYPELHETRLAALGGSTAVWAGWCRPLDPIDLETRDWVADSGWPFGMAELIPYYRRAHQLCGLSAFDYDVAAWEERTGLKRLPLSAQRFHTTVFHVSPVSFGPRYRPSLTRSSNIRILLHATMQRLFAAPHGDRIERASVGTSHGRRFDVAAGAFVLAAGGIENARLLLLSGDSAERSIGNARGLVGRYFMEHGFINAGCCVSTDSSVSMDLYFPNEVPLDGHACTVLSGLAIDPALMRGERLLNSALFLHPAYESHWVFDSSEVRAMLEIWDKLRGRAVPGNYLKRLRHALSAPAKLAIAASRKLVVRRGPQQRWRTRALFECAPNRDNRVSLSEELDTFGRPRARVAWRLSDVDLSSISRSHQLLDQALHGAGLGRFEARFGDDLASWRSAVEGGKHHMGTTRMHSDPTRGVVNADCRVHDIANLFVAGSSVFPTGGFANPTLTIVALAARLAEHLKHRERLTRV